MPPPRETGFSWSALAVSLVAGGQGKTEIPNEPPRRSRGRLGGSFVIQRGRALLNDWPPRIWGRARNSGGGSVSRSRIPGSPPPGCSPLRRAPGVGRLARQGERFASGDGPDADRTSGRSNRATSPARIGSGLTPARCHSRDLARDRSGGASKRARSAAVRAASQAAWPGVGAPAGSGGAGGRAGGASPASLPGRARRHGGGARGRRRVRGGGRPWLGSSPASSPPSGGRGGQRSITIRIFTAASSRLGAGGSGPRSVAPPHPGRIR